MHIKPLILVLTITAFISHCSQSDTSVQSDGGTTTGDTNSNGTDTSNDDSDTNINDSDNIDTSTIDSDTSSTDTDTESDQGQDTESDSENNAENGIPETEYSHIAYIRLGATGNNTGTDWTNALSSFPSSPVRNTLYYLADGEYGSLVLNTPEQGTSFIGLKKATSEDHGPAEDWQPEYGDGVAHFENWQVNTGYWELNGTRGGGPNNWDTGHGFVVRPNWAEGDINGRMVLFASGISNVIIRHTNLHPVQIHQGNGHVFYGLNVSHIYVDSCFAHDNFGVFFLFRTSKNILIQNSHFDNNKSTAEMHAEFMSDVGSDDMIIRNNLMTRIQGTAVFAGVNGSADDPHENWEIYGNIVADSVHFIYFYYAGTDLNKALNWHIHHNTILGVGSGSLQIQESENCVAYNNLWYNFKEPDHYMTLTSSVVDYSEFFDCDIRMYDPKPNDLFSTGDPFVNASARNYNRIAPSAVPGIDLGAKYSTDMFGNIRGADGHRDRGALEFVSQ